MPAQLIIIGYNADNRLKDALAAMASPPEILCVSPNCEIGAAIRVVRPPIEVLNALDAPARAAMYYKPGSEYTLLVDDSPLAKPAEAMVLEFEDRAGAMSFLSEEVPRDKLAGKLILLIDSNAAAAQSLASRELAAPAKETKTKNAATKAAKAPKAKKKAAEPAKAKKPGKK